MCEKHGLIVFVCRYERNYHGYQEVINNRRRVRFGIMVLFECCEIFNGSNLDMSDVMKSSLGMSFVNKMIKEKTELNSRENYLGNYFLQF